MIGGEVMKDDTPRQVSVHVTVERFYEAGADKSLEELLSLTDRLDDALAAVARGWKRPSADEASLVGPEPWHATGSPLDWAEGLRGCVRDAIGMECSIGIARTPLAARVCSRLARPRGVLLWLSGYEDGLLAGLPLEELDELRWEQLRRLRSRGLRTLGDVGGLGAQEARELLGSDSERVLALVRGLETAPDEIEKVDGNRLAKALGLLARRLARKLERDGRRARGIELRIDFRDGVSRERYTLLPKATRDVDELRRSALRLMSLSRARGEPVSGLTLTATGLTGAASQLDLFGKRPREVVVRLGHGAAADPLSA